MDQNLFNTLIAISGALGAWWLKVLWEILRDLQAADKDLVTKVSAIEILVAGSYVKREELERLIIGIGGKLDRIELKLDQKEDKP